MGMIGYAIAIDKVDLDLALADPDAVNEILDSAVVRLDLDKSWHGIHWLLTGDAWEGDGPLGDVILGGEPVGPDQGYGPIRYLKPAEVAGAAEALAQVSEQTLRERFDPAALQGADVYPEIWDEGEDALDYLLGHYSSLVAFYREAAARGDAVLLWIG